METVNKVLETRINNVVQSAFNIQESLVAISETEEVFILRKLGMKVSDYLKENIFDCNDYDIDFEIIDAIFVVKVISGISMTVVDTDAFGDLSKDQLVSFIYSLDNLSSCLSNSIKDYIEEHPEISKSKDIALIPEKTGDVIEKTEKKEEGVFTANYMNDYMFQQLMSTLGGGDPMLAMALMQKREEGKLTKDVIMKLMTMAPNGFHRGGMSNVFMMTYIHNL